MKRVGEHRGEMAHHNGQGGKGKHKAFWEKRQAGTVGRKEVLLLPRRRGTDYMGY